MLYATSVILDAVLSVTLRPETRRFLGASVACVAITASIVHSYYDHTPSFQLVFGAMICAVFCDCVWLVATKVKDRDAVKDMKRLALYGAGMGQ